MNFAVPADLKVKAKKAKRGLITWNLDREAVEHEDDNDIKYGRYALNSTQRLQ